MKKRILSVCIVLAITVSITLPENAIKTIEQEGAIEGYPFPTVGYDYGDEPKSYVPGFDRAVSWDADHHMIDAEEMMIFKEIVDGDK